MEETPVFPTCRDFIRDEWSGGAEMEPGVCAVWLLPGTNQPGMVSISDVSMQSVRQPDVSAEPGPNREEIDISLLEDSLRLTPWQRLLENERALELVRMLETVQPHTDGAAEPNS